MVSSATARRTSPTSNGLTSARATPASRGAARKASLATPVSMIRRHRVQALELEHEVDARASGHHDVRDHDVGTVGVIGAEALPPIVGRDDAMSRLPALRAEGCGRPPRHRRRGRQPSESPPAAIIRRAWYPAGPPHEDFHEGSGRSADYHGHMRARNSTLVLTPGQRTHLSVATSCSRPASRLLSAPRSTRPVVLRRPILRRGLRP